VQCRGICTRSVGGDQVAQRPASPFRRRVLNFWISMDVICPGATERCMKSVGGRPTPGCTQVCIVCGRFASSERRFLHGSLETSPVSTRAINQTPNVFAATYNWCVIPHHARASDTARTAHYRPYQVIRLRRKERDKRRWCALSRATPTQY
jgi:hypothetical protein